MKPKKPDGNGGVPQFELNKRLTLAKIEETNAREHITRTREKTARLHLARARDAGAPRHAAQGHRPELARDAFGRRRIFLTATRAGFS
jgi:hypothetical protein